MHLDLHGISHFIQLPLEKILMKGEVFFFSTCNFFKFSTRVETVHCAIYGPLCHHLHTPDGGVEVEAAEKWLLQSMKRVCCKITKISPVALPQDDLDEWDPSQTICNCSYLDYVVTFDIRLRCTWQQNFCTPSVRRLNIVILKERIQSWELFVRCWRFVM